MKANCRPDQSLTPTGRLAAMEDRLSAMLQALDTVQPALAKFYNSLNDEQKARFDRLDAGPVWFSGSR
ncbi:MAG: Spy/CpxP family protein refolding chaperone [Rhodoplanes sp.]